MTTTQARTEPEHAQGTDPHADHTPAGHHGPHGYSAQKDAHLKRLRRIEGQIRGLQRMVDEDVYCIDVLTQVSAGTKALQSFALSLLEEHLRHCVAAAAEEGGTELDAKVAEATAAISRLLRS
ncbi:metal-sensitive transcriptional regulator [Kitasatospora sp. NPDC002543]